MHVATAGHIDHGKTTLIRALTGVETDRLPEEQARGISIDLGFAYWRPDTGATIGFIDVPGHERFLRNMLAGVSGVDFALLVIAVDDGIMPQTIEHLRILNLLGIARGVVALTKCDRVGPERIAELRGEANELLTANGFADARLFEVSSVNGAGIAALSAALIAERDRRDAAQPDGRGFRLAIDRAFSVTGVGSVVTGTVTAGRAAIGETLTVSPLGREVRLRGMQSGGEAIESIAAGQRCALNLVGVEVSELHRGDWLVDPALHTPSGRIEAQIEILTSRGSPLRHDSRIHLHIGTADLGARVLMPRQRAIRPGETGVAQLVLDSSTSAVSGQRFVLRDQSGRDLLGGGRVINPHTSHKRRPLAMRQAMAAALTLADPAESLATLAAIPGLEPDTGWFALSNNLSLEMLSGLIGNGAFVQIGKSGAALVSANRHVQLAETLLEVVAKHHREHPELGGMTRREARLGLGEPVSPDLLASLLRLLVADGRIAAEGALVRLPDHSVSFSPIEAAMWQGALVALEDHAPRPIIIADLARELRASEAGVRAMLFRRRSNGDVWQVTETRFMLREHVTALVEIAAKLDAVHGGFKAAEFRDASGIGRNFVIQLLEFFDRIGVTRRSGEIRRIRGDWEALVGPAER